MDFDLTRCGDGAVTTSVVKLSALCAVTAIVLKNA